MIPIWVIYQRPTDYPDAPFVMRKHHINERKKEGRVTPTAHCYTAETIEELRLKIPDGKQRMVRSPKDEPQIVEWWF
jgi:hypothetical protein